MCTWIIHTAAMSGSAKGPSGWFKLRQANVYYDHPYHAPMDHALIIDFVDRADAVGNRAAIEIDAESARALAESILAALASGEDAHALDPHDSEPRTVATAN